MITKYRFITTFAATFLMLTCRALAQSQSDYDTISAAKLAQGSLAADRLTTEYQQQDDLNAAISSDQSTVNQLTNTVQADTNAKTQAQAQLDSAEATLSNDSAPLSGLQNQLSSAANAVNADANQYDEDWDIAMGYADEYQELVDEAGDDPDNTDFYLLEASIVLSDEFDAEAQMETDYAQYLSDLAPEQALAAQVSAVQAQVSADQQAVNSAESSLDTAVAELSVDSTSLANATDQLNTDNNSLTALEPQIENDEDIVTGQESWLQANPTYDAWIANGAPDYNP